MALGLGVIAAINFASSYLNGVKNRNQALQQANSYAQQADIFRQNAAKTRLNGALNEDVLRAQNRSYLSRGLAAAGEAGMAESPTLMSLLSTSASALEQNVLNQRYQTESEAENYLYQARVAEYNAHQNRKKSRNVFKSGLINGIGSALTSISQPNSMY